MRSTTETLIAAMRILERDIQSGDCVASVAIAEAADRLEEQQARIAEIESLVARLADMMRRSYTEEFTSEVKPVASAEWFGALHDAEALLSERDQSEHPLGMGGDHLRDATKMAELEARIAELEAQAAIGRRAVVSGLAVGEPFAWATFDGEGGYDLRLYEGNESYRDDWQAVNRRFRDWVIPLYDAEPDPAAVEVDAGALEALREAVGYLDKQPVHLLSISRARAEVLVIEAARRLLAGGE